MNRKHDSIYSVNQVADLLGADTNDVIDAVGLTLGELELAAIEIGLAATYYRSAPVLREQDIAVIASRLDAQPYL